MTMQRFRVAPASRRQLLRKALILGTSVVVTRAAPAIAAPASAVKTTTRHGVEIEENPLMPDIKDEALEFLLARAGLQLTDEQKAELMTVYAGIAAMAERVRKPRGHMAELAHVYNFSEEDLA